MPITIADAKSSAPNDHIALWEQISFKCKQFTDTEPDFLHGISPEAIVNRKKELLEYKTDLSNLKSLATDSIYKFNDLETRVKKSLYVKNPDQDHAKQFAIEMGNLSRHYQHRVQQFQSFVAELEKNIQQHKHNPSYVLAIYQYFLAHLYSECPHTTRSSFPNKSAEHEYQQAKDILLKVNDPHLTGTPYRQIMLTECENALLVDKVTKDMRERQTQQSSFSFFKPVAIIAGLAGLWTGGIGTAVTYGFLGLCVDQYLESGVNTMRDKCCKRK